MGFKGGIILIFFCGMSIFTFTNCSTCKPVTEGDPFSISVPKLKPGVIEEVKWKHNEKLIFKKQKDTPLYVGDQNVDLNEDNSLTIKNVKQDSGGKYVVEVFAEDGTSIGNQEINICVYEKLQKPNVTIICKESEVVVVCAKPQKAVEIKWYRSQEWIKEKTSNLTIKGSTKDKFKCVWENPANHADSDEVACSSETEITPKLFGFDQWIMIAILAGGGGLVLLLMIVLLTCACRSCKRREKHILDQEEFKLNFNTPPQRSKHTARGQPAPPIPQDDPEVSNYEVDDPPPKPQSRTKNQHRVRPPPPPIDDDGEQPPPLPQPRKKSPHAKKNQVEESRARPLYMQP